MTETTSSKQRPGATACLICGGYELDDLPFEYAFKNRRLGGVRCRKCGLVYISPQPSALEIEEMYDESYFNTDDAEHGAHGNRAYMEQATESGESRSESAAALDAILSKGEERGLFLEVGCGPGFFLKEMERLGWAVSGLEISSYAVEFATKSLDLPVKRGVVTADAFPAGYADAVFMGDVLEHLADPARDLRTIHGWLKPGGQIGIAVPSTLSLWSAQLGFFVYRALGRKKVLRIPPYHLVEFVPATLRTLLESCGYQVTFLKVSAVPIGKMGLRGSAWENFGKVMLQVAAHGTSRLVNRWGDRILAVAVKKE